MGQHQIKPTSDSIWALYRCFFLFTFLTFLSLKTCFSGCFEPLKKEQSSMKIHLKNGKIYFASSFPLHLMSHMEPMFQDLPCYWHKKVPKNHNQFFFTFVTGMELTSWCLLWSWYIKKRHQAFCDTLVY